MTRIAVLADCHIHPGGGSDWNESILAALAGVDLIVTLGDMGEAIGLERLAEIAPVKGVMGADDQQSPHTQGRSRLLSIDGVSIALVFDPVAEGLATSKDPLQLVSPQARAAKLGGEADVLLWASTHVPDIGRENGVLTLNPGSATLPDGGAAPSFGRLTVANGQTVPEIVSLA